MTINHINIVVADLEKSLAFYVGLLGMRETFRCELSGAWIESVVGLREATAKCAFVQPVGGGCRIELLEYLLPEGASLSQNSLANTSGLRHFAIEVEDLDTVYQTLSDAGVAFLSPPVTVPFRLIDSIQKRLCYSHDPDGVIVEFCEHRRV
jgi:glyoxylase I family protein